MNTHTHQVTTTGENGLYSILAQQGDVITFSYLGYQAVERTKPPSVIVATLNVIMHPVTYQLKEFQLRPGNLTPYQVDSMERARIYKVPLQRTHPNPIMNPASAIAEKFSRKAKRVYQFQKNFAAGEREKYIDLRYTPDLVNTLTGLSGDSIGFFMYAYPMPYDFARTATDLEISAWVRSNFKEWRK